MRKTKRKKPTVLDLFSGCGGLSAGFLESGYKIIMGIDNWDVALESFRINHSGSRILSADLSNLDPSEAAKEAGISRDDVDVIVGGPPCQGFSISGKRKIDDPRNSLYKAFVHFIDYFMPGAFIMENVPNLVSMSGGAVREKILKDLSNLGYGVVYKILLASDYGVPQNRRRVFFVGLKGGDNFEFPEETHGDGKSPKISIKEAISDLPENGLENGASYKSNPLTNYQISMRSKSKGIYNHEPIEHSLKTKQIISLVPDGGNYKDLPKNLRSTRKVNIAWTRFSSDKPSLTIDTGHNHHFHYKYNRVPTARESARLQSFEDSFIFAGKKNEQIKQIGNAVPPMLSYSIANQLKNYL